MATKMKYNTASFKERQNIVNIASLPDNCLAVVNSGLAAEIQYNSSSHSGQTVSARTTKKRKKNALSVVNPELAAEWHPTKNGDLTPEMVTAGSGRKAWWKCKLGHEWQATISSRNRGNGCLYCSGHEVWKGFNDLATVNPGLAAEWHPSKNGDLTPDMVLRGTNKKVWWLGKCGHEWQASIANRSKGRKCPYCSGRIVLKGFNDLATANPVLASEWNQTKNGTLTPDMVTKGCNTKVWWKCNQGHEWKMSVSERSSGYNCPFCSHQRILEGYNDLKTINQKLASEWHPTKNGDLKPDMVTPASGKKVWWLGKCGHEWMASISHRNRGQSCPYCSNHKALKGFNDLKTINPKLASEWNLIKNGDLTPDMVLMSSNKKVWWTCRAGHEWMAKVSDRTRGSNCPYCGGKKALKGFNDLATLNPELASEWHPTKNGNLTPAMVTKGGRKKVWWLGKCGHEWQSTIANRFKGVGCPICKGESQTSFAEQAVYYYIRKQFPEAKNRDISTGKEFDIYIPSIRVAVEYDGVFYHTDVHRDERKTKWCKSYGIRLIRIREKGCPDLVDKDIVIRNGESDKSLNDVIVQVMRLLNLNGFSIDVERDRLDIYNQYITAKKNNSIAIVYPKISSEWHPTKNGLLKPDMITCGSDKKVWWICKRSHEWKDSVCNRIKGRGCPYCSNHRVLKGFNDLKTTAPKLASEWHPTKNGDLTPEMVTAGSGKKVWWLCKRYHEWKATVVDRNNGCDCPYCSGRIVLKGFNDLATVNPELAAEWHQEKNEGLTPDMATKNSGKKVWWQCKQGHEWRATIDSRSKGAGCPYCAGHKVLKGVNDLATVNPELAAEWHPTKNGVLTPDMVTRSARKKVWWQCKQGHDWQTTINNRSGGRGCPFCAGKKVLRGFNDLATVNHKLAAEWHPTKNGDLTPDNVTKSSNKKVWWQCKQRHEWQATIASRNNGNGCPTCARQRQKHRTTA